MARGLHITARDLELLSFAAEHRIFLADHVRALLGASDKAANARLLALGNAGLIVRRKVFEREPPLHWITRPGLAAIASPLPAPRLDLRCYEHDVGLAWLWLAAHDGMFGPVEKVIGERRLRSSDARRERGEAPLAVRLGGYGADGRERLHYPDLIVVDPQGRRTALELELSGKGRRRLGGILGAYGADARIDAVVYLVADRALGRAVSTAAARVGMASRVHVQDVRSTVGAPGEPGGSEAARTSSPSRTASRSPSRSRGPSRDDAAVRS